MKDEELNLLVEAVLTSRKYRNICTDLVRNIGRRELSNRRNLREAVKSTKNKLHQIGGAYFLTRPRYGAWFKKLAEGRESGGKEFKKACMEIMGTHQSTRERLKIIDEFYEAISLLGNG